MLNIHAEAIHDSWPMLKSFHGHASRSLRYADAFVSLYQRRVQPKLRTVKAIFSKQLFGGTVLGTFP